MKRKVYVVGISGSILYFFSVLFYLITKFECALTLWEIMTIVGAAIIFVVLTKIAVQNDMHGSCRIIMLTALAGTTIITSVAHITSIGVIRPLEAQGQAIPDYFKIGHFPSIEMTLDYTAWGLFMGVAFLALFLGIKKKTLKIISAICSTLCFTGFIGSFYAEYLWYPAPLGYGFGFLILCLFCLFQKQRK